MEDASKEFQVFLSPTRNYPERAQQTVSKHRIVPVINQCQPCTSSTFTINQRKNCVIYKAVSGVSFQETDTYEEIPSNKKQKHSSGRKRSDSHTVSKSERSPQATSTEPSGARRSRSLTNMKGDIYDLEGSQTNVTEITHPFTPVILYSQPRGGGGRQSRYARARERRRASSQARPNLGNAANDDGAKCNTEQPVRPRRTRSASRTRKKPLLQSFSSESSLNDADVLKKKYLSSYDENHYLIKPKNTQPSSSCHIYEIPREVDLNVNETDWKKYDVLITEKLDNLLQRKLENEGKMAVEPEGGYFSLEREENETDAQAFADAFQQDNYNETIYVSQTFKEKCCIENKKQRIFQMPEMELADYTTVQEVGYPDDEGLYEEIFFDPKEKQQNNPFYHLDVRENTAYFHPPPPPDTEPPEEDMTHYVPIIERKENSTVVYIRCNDIPKKEANKSLVNIPSENSNLEADLSEFLNQAKSLESLNQHCRPQDRRPSHSPWRSCCNADGSRRSKSINHCSSCIQGKSGVITAKYSSLVDLDNPEGQRFKDLPLTPKIARSKRSKSYNLPGFPSGITKSTSAVNLGAAHRRTNERESELSDIDLEIFAPKLSQSRRRKENMFGSNSRPTRYLKRKDYSCMGHSSQSLGSKKRDNIPQTFQGFLQNSFFNPPVTETCVDDSDVESLVIKEDQIVTCITDSSSDSSDDGVLASSPWLEAKNEFEYVAFKEESALKDCPKPSKKRKTNRLLSLHKMMYGSQPDIDGSSCLAQNANEEVTTEVHRKDAPQRPSRRRTRRRPPNWEVDT